MTVSTTTNEKSYTGDGTNTALPTEFPFINDTDLVVTQRVRATGVETVLALATHYEVSGGSYAIGAVTPVDGATDFPSTVTWTIKRATPQTQLTNYVDNDDFGAETHERALDKAMYVLVDMQEEIDRAIKVAVTDDDPGELPNSVDRADKYFGFDGSGNPAVLDAPTDTSITTLYSQTLLDDADAAAARATLEAQEDVITTRGDIVRGSSGAVAERLARGASGTYLGSDGSDPSWSEPPLPRSYLAGLAVTHTSTTEFTVAKGACRCGSSTDQDLVNAKNTNAAFSKTFVDPAGTPWTAADGGPGVALGAGFAATIDTWHFFMLVANDGSGTYNFGWDTDIDAANLIADAGVVTALGASCYYRRIRSNVSTATPTIVAFLEHGDKTLLDVAVQDIFVGGPGTGILTHTLASVPAGLLVEALLSIVFLLNGDGFHKVGYGDISTLGTPGDDDKDCQTDAGENSIGDWSGPLLTNTSAQIKTISSADPSGVDVQVHGWVDRRGRDD